MILNTARAHTALRPGQFQLLAPSAVTYAGARTDPVHRWFAYPEAFSPEYVRWALQSFAPEARTVLDPFAGMGTTPTTASAMGLDAFYCELNPLLQRLIDAKTLFGSLPRRERTRLVHVLADAPRVVGNLLESPADEGLRLAYAKLFGSSTYFAPDTYEAVLRARRGLDRLEASDPILAMLVSIGLLASLVPSSLLIRRGDLRYRTERDKGPSGFADLMVTRLVEIAESFREPEEADIRTRPVFLAANALSLRRLPRSSMQAVMTSPPYLNGTNYSRNTKLELWFLRAFRTADDVKDIRRQSITAGINDVVGPPSGDDLALPASVHRLVQDLAASAYDQRIPKLVLRYFLGMRLVAEGIREQLVEGGRLLVDIGDSKYGPVAVRTDQLLAEVIESVGFNVHGTYEVRKRASRDGSPLRQVLIVAELLNSTTDRPAKPGWFNSWRRFKAEVPYREHPMSKRNWGHPRHSLCSFQGKLKPSLAQGLVSTFVPTGGAVLDPFGGTGTIALEAALSGRRSTSIDISPAAHWVAKAKLGQYDGHLIEATIERLGTLISSYAPSASELAEADAVRFNGRLADYFHPKTFREVLAARRFFAQEPPSNASEALVLASLLHILHGNRPYALSRRSHPITPFAPSGPSEYRPLVPRLWDKVSRSVAAAIPGDFIEGQALLQDATQPWSADVGEVDAVITSPPFFSSTRFYSANWMRLWFSGWASDQFRSEPRRFVEHRQLGGMGVYEPVLRQAREHLRANGVVVLHLGVSHKMDMADALVAVARPWFKLLDRFDEDVNHIESHGIRDKGTVNGHSVVVLG